MSNKLLEFQQAYQNLELLPLLTQRELERFRVDYGQEVINELRQLVDDSPSADSKIIFTGHRGCGKSTLLAEFARQCAATYFVVLFSISDTIEMSDINHINILFSIAVNLMVEAEKKQIEINSQTQQKLYNWFAIHTKVQVENIQAESGIGFDLFKIITGKLKADSAIRHEIKQEFQPKVSELIARINEIASLIQGATKQEVLVIIDDLDKLDLALVQSIYRDNIKALFQPHFRIVFTIPIAALRDKNIKPIIDTETNDQKVILPVLKLFEKGGNRNPDSLPISENMEILTEILKRRISEQLLPPEIAYQIILYSGGVLRELIRLTNECCRICLRLVRRHSNPETVKIDESIFADALINFQNDFATPLGKKDYQLLCKIYQEFVPEDPNQTEFLELLHGLHIIEYKGRQNWYDVHPVVIEILKDRGVI